MDESANLDVAPDKGLHTERWVCREYRASRGVYFIRNRCGGPSIASSLDCGRDRARLMAAAPELLEALIALTEDASPNSDRALDTTDSAMVRASLILRARAVIATAT